MLTIFNRKELTLALSTEQQAGIRELLTAHHIDYALKLVDRSGMHGLRARMGGLGLNMDACCQYIFYVHRRDYEQALAALAGRLHL